MGDELTAIKNRIIQNIQSLVPGDVEAKLDTGIRALGDLNALETAARRDERRKVLREIDQEARFWPLRKQVIGLIERMLEDALAEDEAGEEG